MFKVSFTQDFSALSCKRLMKLIIFLETLLLNVHGQTLKDYSSESITLKNDSM